MDSHVVGQVESAATKSEEELSTKPVVSGGEWHHATLGTKIVNKSTIVHNYEQGSLDTSTEGTYRLSAGIIVYENNPICPESRIYRAKLLSKVVGDRDVIVKLLPFGQRQQQEAKIHFSVPHHRNIVERIFTDVFSYRGQQTIFIAMECCDDQNMYDFVTSQSAAGVPFDPQVYLSYSRQVATGLEFLHAHNIVNRDLKPPNLLLADDKTVVKIADFGMCKEIKPGRDDVTLSKLFPGTIGWSAPEILRGEKKIGISSDIFLLGLVFHFLWTYGKHPFGDDPHAWNYFIKINENMNLDGISIPNANVGRALIQSMLQQDPKMRPSATQVLAHEIFKETSDNDDHQLTTRLQDVKLAEGNLALFQSVLTTRNSEW